MGERHLILVQKDNEIKIAQYGQWDGFPSGNGVSILNFCKDKSKLSKLKAKLNLVSFLSTEELKKFHGELLRTREPVNLPYYNQFLSRDVSSDILENIINLNTKVKLDNSFNFGYNSLLCEWGYAINFDTHKLEAYKGFNRKKLNPSERFYAEKRVYDKYPYYGIKLIKEYDLDNLPDEKTFIIDLEG